MQAKRTLVLGIGNVLMSDEGVGVQVVRHLQQSHPDRSDATFLDGGTLSFSLAGELAEHDWLIVVDAAFTGKPPGSLSCYEGEAMRRYLQGNRQSVHEVGLADLLDISRLSGDYPEHIALLGIEPENLDWGERLSERVARAVPEASRRILEMLANWQRQEAD